MDERTAEQLAAIVGGESWQSGGGIHLVTVNRDDGSLVVFSDDAICEYENDEAFDAGRVEKTIHLRIPDCADVFEASKTDGEVFGVAMRNALSARLQQRRTQGGASLFDCLDEHLEGYAYGLTSECQVWWSPPFDIKEAG